MAKKVRFVYKYNQDTLLYEKTLEAKWKQPARYLLYTLSVVGLIVFWFYLYADVLALEFPKTASLTKKNAEWQSKMAVLDRDLDHMETALFGIEERDDNVYRSIFGLEPIPTAVKAAGFGGANRYAYLDQLGSGSELKISIQRMDVMTKRSYLQSRALDEILVVSKQAENMISCVPAVPPILPQRGTYRVSSPFGPRKDPVFKRAAIHDGVDLATHKGNPVYTTGNGVVEKVRFQTTGYGYEVVVDHGFGYTTRYAHLNSIDVKKGDILQRGDRVGTVGSTGKSTGPHLHYEVRYKGKAVNPMGFMDLNMRVDEFNAMLNHKEKAAGSENSDGLAQAEEEPVEEYAF